MKTRTFLLLLVILVYNAVAGRIVVSSNMNWDALVPSPTPSDTVLVTNSANLIINTAGICSAIQVGGSTEGSGDGILTFAASSQLSVLGKVTLGSSPRNGTVSMSNGGTLICGGLTFSAGFWEPGTGTVRFTADNSLPDTNALASFNNLIIGSGATTLTRDITIHGDLSVSSGTLNVSSFSASRVSQGGTFNLSNGAFLRIEGTHGFPGNFLNNSIGVLSTTEYAGSDQDVAGVVYGNLILSGSGVKTTGSAATANGSLVVDHGVTFLINGMPLLVSRECIVNGTIGGSVALVLSATPDVSIDGSGTIAVPVEIYCNKTIASTATLTFTSTISISGAAPPIVTNHGTVTISISGGLTGLHGSTWTNAANSTLNVAGQLFVGQQLFTGTLVATANPNTVRYFGSSIAQTIKGTAYHNLVIDRSGGTATLGAATVVVGNLTITSGMLATNKNSLMVTGLTNVSGGKLSITGDKTGNIVFGDLALESGGIFDNSVVNDDVIINGDVVNRGSFLAGSGTCSLLGSTTQILGQGNLSFNNLVVNNPSDVRLSQANVQVEDTLSLLKGRIVTGSNLVTIIAGGLLNRDSGYVAGNLCKTLASGQSDIVFEVGDSAISRYTPVRISAGITSSGNMTVNTVSKDHPNIGSSGFDSSKTLNRHWSLAKSPQLIMDRIDSIEFQFDSSDRDAGLVLSSEWIAGRRYAQSAWSGNFRVDSIAPTTIRVKPRGIDSLDIGEYQIGLPALSVTINGFPEDTAVVASRFAHVPSVKVISGGVGRQAEVVVFTIVPGASGASANFANGSVIDSVVTDSQGVASSDSLTANTRTGSFKVLAQAINATVAVIFTRTNLSGPSSTDSSVVTAGRDTLIANGLDTTAIIIQVRDRYGNDVSSNQDSIHLAINNPQLGSLIQPTYVGSGRYVGRMIASHSEGRGVVSAFINESPISDVAYIQFLKAEITIDSFSEDTTVVTGTFMHPPTLRITLGGTGRESEVAVFKVISATDGASGKFSNGSIFDSALTNSSGLASSDSLTANKIKGRFVVQAWVIGGSDTVNFSRTNLPGSSSTDSSSVVVGRDSLVADGLDTTVIVIQLKDRYGNLLDQSGDSVRLAIDNPQLVSLTQPTYVGGGQFIGKAQATHVEGRGTVSALINSSPISTIAHIQFLSPANPNELPNVWALGQNYPNPFNNETTILFDVPLESPSVRIAFYDVLGKRIMTYEQSNVQRGTYELRWQGKADNGTHLGSGVYFYRIETPLTTMIRKLILLK